MKPGEFSSLKQRRLDSCRCGSFPGQFGFITWCFMFDVDADWLGHLSSLCQSEGELRLCVIKYSNMKILCNQFEHSFLFHVFSLFLRHFHIVDTN